MDQGFRILEFLEPTNGRDRHQTDRACELAAICTTSAGAFALATWRTRVCAGALQDGQVLDSLSHWRMHSMKAKGMLACTQRATLSCLELGETDRADVRLCHVVLVVAVAVVAAVPASRGTVVLSYYNTRSTTLQMQ